MGVLSAKGDEGLNILMFTNTYRPIVGGVSESVQRLKGRLQAEGHRVLVVAPKLQGQPRHEPDVIRVAAVQHFNGSDFSLPVPIPGQLYEAIEAFEPDIVHSHHPFLLGDTAARAAETYGLPLVFTHHTLYEHYTHYVPGDSPRMQRFAVALSTEYTHLCDAVIAPSESTRSLLFRRGANSAVYVVPSGVDTRRFANGDGRALRRRMGIPESAYLVGHVGRLAQEKNLPFLARAVADWLAGHPEHVPALPRRRQRHERGERGAPTTRKSRLVPCRCRRGGLPSRCRSGLSAMR